MIGCLSVAGCKATGANGFTGFSPVTNDTLGKGNSPNRQKRRSFPAAAHPWRDRSGEPKRVRGTNSSECKAPQLGSERREPQIREFRRSSGGGTRFPEKTEEFMARPKMRSGPAADGCPGGSGRLPDWGERAQGRVPRRESRQAGTIQRPKFKRSRFQRSGF
jgi:hypothetical protein